MHDVPTHGTDPRHGLQRLYELGVRERSVYETPRAKGHEVTRTQGNCSAHGYHQSVGVGTGFWSLQRRVVGRHRSQRARGSAPCFTPKPRQRIQHPSACRWSLCTSGGGICSAHFLSTFRACLPVIPSRLREETGWVLAVFPPRRYSRI